MVSLYDCNFEFPAKQDIFLKIKELCHLANTKPEDLPFNFFRYLIQFSRYEGKSEMVSLYGGHFGFSRQTGYCFKNKELCHLVHKTSEQMPFKFLRYLIQISRYEDKSEMVSLYVILNFPPNRIIFENQRIVLLCKYET